MKHFFSAVLTLCIGFILTACSESIDEEYAANYGEMVDVRINIAAESPSRHARAANEGQYVADVEPWELMKLYRVAFADPTSGKIYATIDKNLVSPAEADYIDAQLRAGQYKVYGFVNIPYATLDAMGIRKGETMPDLSNTRYTVGQYFSSTFGEKLLPMETFKADFYNDVNSGIPMTSINGQEVTVTERVNQTFGIEVRRLLAKLQFDYSYRMPVGSPDLVLKSQSIKNITFGTDVLLMNYEEDRDNLNNGAALTFKQLSHVYGTAGKTLVANGDAGGKLFSQCFYVLESQGDADTNSFELDFDIEKADGTTPVEDKVRYAITQQETITLIHRNDWIIIPVTIGEWLMDMDVYCYPPIGGYPEAHVDKESETVFHVTFDSPGDIALYLNFHRYFDLSSRFYLTDLGRIKSVSIDGPIGDAIFDKAPRYSAGEITARLKSAEGTAYIDVEVEFIPNPAQPSVTKKMKRRIYMTRKDIA